jgi:SPP1 gp7 family putative phage head morphogenesis protein
MMNIAWDKGAQSTNQWIIDHPEDAIDPTNTTFEGDSADITLPLSFGNKDAAAFHRFKAFSSAVIKDSELSDAVKESLSKALEQGSSLEEWKKGVTKIFDDLGYTRLNNYQARFIWRNETAQAFGAGQFAKLQDVSSRYPYWEYSTAHDDRVRPAHRALDGKIFSVSDKQYYPPIGWNCRCTAIPVSLRQAEKRGIIKPDTVSPEMVSQLGDAEFIGNKVLNFEDWVNERTRQMSTQSVQLIINMLSEIIDTIINQAP